MTNAEYIRMLRSRAEAEGFCVICRRRRPPGTYKTCDECRCYQSDRARGVSSRFEQLPRRRHRCSACNRHGHNRSTCARRAA
jgi:hypothetical protein